MTIPANTTDYDALLTVYGDTEVEDHEYFVVGISEPISGFTGPMTTARELTDRYEALVAEEKDLADSQLSIITQAEIRKHKSLAFRKATLLDELFEFLRTDPTAQAAINTFDQVVGQKIINEAHRQAQRTRLVDVAMAATAVLRGFRPN